MKVVVGDATRTPLPDASTDWLVAAFLFDLMPDGRELLRETRRVLRPDGTLVLLTVFHYQHENLWTYFGPERVLGLVEECGFEVKDAIWIEHPHLASPHVIKLTRYKALRILAQPTNPSLGKTTGQLRPPWGSASRTKNQKGKPS